MISSYGQNKILSILFFDKKFFKTIRKRLKSILAKTLVLGIFIGLILPFYNGKINDSEPIYLRIKEEYNKVIYRKERVPYWISTFFKILILQRHLVKFNTIYCGLNNFPIPYMVS